MALLKKTVEIALIEKSAVILSKAHGVIAKNIQPGITTEALDKLAEAYICQQGAKPSFKGYNNFPCSTCISVNDEIVHGLPGKYILKEGDIVSVDCGVYYQGYHSDAAYTHTVGLINSNIAQLLQVTKQALDIGINELYIGKRIGDVGYAIQHHAEKYGFSIVRELVGHGIGKKLHEAPNVPNYGKKGHGIQLKKGMVLAIEPMVNLGKKKIIYEKNGCVRTFDKHPSAHFEHTVAILDNGPKVLTTFKYIEEI